MCICCCWYVLAVYLPKARNMSLQLLDFFLCAVFSTTWNVELLIRCAIVIFFFVRPPTFTTSLANHLYPEGWYDCQKNEIVDTPALHISILLRAQRGEKSRAQRSFLVLFFIVLIFILWNEPGIGMNWMDEYRGKLAFG